jgi:hypothetical protein
VPTKLSEDDIRYGTANYKVIGLNSVVGKRATFRLQPISRTKDVVIPITLKYGNQSRTFTYTILAEEAVPSQKRLQLSSNLWRPSLYLHPCRAKTSYYWLC